MPRPPGQIFRRKVSHFGLVAWSCLVNMKLIHKRIENRSISGSTPSLVGRMTDTCENITFPKLRLRVLKNVLRKSTFLQLLAIFLKTTTPVMPSTLAPLWIKTFSISWVFSEKLGKMLGKRPREICIRM